MSTKGKRRGVSATPVASTAQSAGKVANSFAEYGVGFAPSVGLISSQSFDAPNIDLEKTEEEAPIGFGDTGLQFAEPISLGPYRSFDAENTDIYDWISDYIDQHLIVDESIFSAYNAIAGQCSFVLRQISSFGVYNDKRRQDLFLKLNGLLAEIEAVASEVCPQHIEKIRHLAALVGDQSRLHLPVDQGQYSKPEAIGTSYTLPAKAPILYAERAFRPELAGSNIIEFLRAVYGQWLNGELTRPYFRQLDPAGEMALRNWLRAHAMPDDIKIPTKSECIDQALASVSKAGNRPLRLEWARKARVRARQAVTP